MAAGEAGEEAAEAVASREAKATAEEGADIAAPSGFGPDEVRPDGFSFDIDDPKYRMLREGERKLEYTLQGEELIVDYVEGGGAASMLKRVLETEGADVRRISGYITDKLGNLSDEALLRYWGFASSPL